jgi:hypothetical protein
MAKGAFDLWSIAPDRRMLEHSRSTRREPTMTHLRLVTNDEPSAPTAPVDDRPRVSLRLLMAASGRCSCDACLIAYRLGDRDAGVVTPRRPAARLSAVR